VCLGRKEERGKDEREALKSRTGEKIWKESAKGNRLLTLSERDLPGTHGGHSDPLWK
jgi:hypothetical protein